MAARCGQSRALKSSASAISPSARDLKKLSICLKSAYFRHWISSAINEHSSSKKNLVVKFAGVFFCPAVLKKYGRADFLGQVLKSQDKPDKITILIRVEKAFRVIGRAALLKIRHNGRGKESAQVLSCSHFCSHFILHKCPGRPGRLFISRGRDGASGEGPDWDGKQGLRRKLRKMRTCC